MNHGAFLTTIITLLLIRGWSCQKLTKYDKMTHDGHEKMCYFQAFFDTFI